MVVGMDGNTRRSLNRELLLHPHAVDDFFFFFFFSGAGWRYHNQIRSGQIRSRKQQQEELNGWEDGRVG